jgi:hypothetical protein
MLTSGILKKHVKRVTVAAWHHMAVVVAVLAATKMTIMVVAVAGLAVMKMMTMAVAVAVPAIQVADVALHQWTLKNNAV